VSVTDLKAEALAQVEQLRRERDEARDVAERNARDCAHLRQSAITLERERDEARAEVERLRALLAEARQELAVLASYVDDPETKWPTVGLKLTAKAHKRAVTRIDAALAEPVVDMEASASRGWQMADSLHLSVKEQRERAEKAERERDEARAMLSAICSEFERAVSHADWRAAGSPGMSVPFTGDFASATQIPSVVGRMRWWAREMRKAIGEGKP
jgi:chromosome segregation ATPase